jgi:hypothetical protein
LAQAGLSMPFSLFWQEMLAGILPPAAADVLWLCGRRGKM